MKKRILFLSLLVIALITGLYGYTEYNRKNKDLLDVKPTVSIESLSLIKAYEENPEAFHQRYTDQVITVRGTVKKIDAEENPVVITLGNSEEFSSVQCSMDSTHSEMYKTVKEGQVVALKGICTGGRTEELFGTDIIVNRCVVE